MPIAPTYPGVYIEEIPSGVRTITGVATSITAFIGRAVSGPVNEPTIINSFGDYERRFGGLSLLSTMSYAVRDFYLNGGSQAIIVRVIRNGSTARISLPVETTSPPVTSPPAASLFLDAASAGGWGANLSATVDFDTADPTKPKTSPPAAPDPELFNLVVTLKKDDGTVQQEEKFLLVSMNPTSRRFLPRVLDQNSLLVRVPRNSSGFVVPVGPGGRPARPRVTSSPVAAVGGRDGDDLTATEITGVENDKTGIYALEKADLFNLLCIPPPTRDADTDPSVYQAAMQYCTDRRAMLIVDSPLAWGARAETAAGNATSGLGTLNLSGTAARNAALYFPRVVQPDPLRDRQLDTFVPCGIIAGVMARTDSQRGVWKAPAGIDAALNGIQGLQVNLTDDENGQLNPLGINCLRSFPVTGRVVWGARTLRGADQLADEYKYVPVRRTALFIEESLYRGTQWVVFEPNDEPLWAQIRLNVGAFMQNLFRQGAFQGKTPREAYFVKCDKETTTQNDINLGIVNILVGFAPLKPAEFVIIKVQQIAGQIDT
ncbi:MAG TPA: phage tail sheath C-terminal domain-containing protein [Pyrinomonadaceae bacterium]|jgi:phage tail sheath protein FI|nr:phage tail sheath C-terminal domain-containing protein [Pyrinomonadaceae bacterium]